MTYTTCDEEWLAIAARIAALQGSALLRAQQEQSNTEDSYGVRAMLGDECAAIITLLQQFAITHEPTLPEPVKTAIDRFLKKRPPRSIMTSPDEGPAMRAAVVALPLIAAEVPHLLTGRQERLRLRPAQAFELLQRVLAVDADVRQKWHEAFREKGEVSCEQLGAVHLLGFEQLTLHNIA